MAAGPELDAATVLLQWASGGLLFCWVTTRHNEVGLGYGWLLRGTYAAIAILAAIAGFGWASMPLRDSGSVVVAGIALVTLILSITWRPNRAGDHQQSGRLYDSKWDLLAPSFGFVALAVAGLTGGGNELLQTARIIVGAAFLGAVTDAMLLGHWYLVQPGLKREPLIEQVSWLGKLWPVEVGLLLLPTGMFSVLSGTIDDSYGGMLGWFWAACAITTGALVLVTRAALRERQYAAVMAATGLLYLAILTAFGTDVVARLVLET